MDAPFIPSAEDDDEHDGHGIDDGDDDDGDDVDVHDASTRSDDSPAGNCHACMMMSCKVLILTN